MRSLHRPSGEDLEGGGSGAEASLLGRVRLLPAAAALRADEREGEVLLHRPQSQDLNGGLIAQPTLKPCKFHPPVYELFIVLKDKTLSTGQLLNGIKCPVKLINVQVKH